MTTARKKSNRSRADLLPCARSGCNEKRVPGSPYCRTHRNEMQLASYHKHKDKILAKKRDNSTKGRLQAERDKLAALLRRLREWDVLVMDKGDGEFWRREIDAALAVTA